jgi:hypothetical protein
MAEAMRDTSARASLALGSDKAERVDLPPYRSLNPGTHVFSLSHQHRAAGVILSHFRNLQSTGVDIDRT